ncbi:hypothetical protein BJ508DRAFT_418667 [Ascobolus immersus RN42]|uniref:Uncharacterized protein n=1 Tax=Ascobolus immersus RN42 TaxID=1160509 RepID=A0A3N4HPA4_ASCIM|nr:hypothetical protein BJ508DRAFT_418667 [Ascobolus immersus RN42]
MLDIVGVPKSYERLRRVRQLSLFFPTIEPYFPDPDTLIYFEFRMFAFYQNLAPDLERIVLDLSSLRLFPTSCRSANPKLYFSAFQRKISSTVHLPVWDYTEENCPTIHPFDIHRLVEHTINPVRATWPQIVLKTRDFRHKGDRLMVHRKRGKSEGWKNCDSFFSRLFTEKPITLFSEDWFDGSVESESMSGVGVMYQPAATMYLDTTRNERTYGWKRIFAGLKRKGECDCHLPLYLFWPHDVRDVQFTSLHLEGVRIKDAVSVHETSITGRSSEIWQTMAGRSCKLTRLLFSQQGWLKSLVLKNVVLEGNLFEGGPVVLGWKVILKHLEGGVWMKLEECILVKLHDGACGEKNEVGSEIVEGCAKRMIESKGKAL